MAPQDRLTATFTMRPSRVAPTPLRPIPQLRVDGLSVSYGAARGRAPT